jgi:broad specificity phosphatase PhoE
VTKIYLVRHGATDWNVDKRAQGQADIPMNALGYQQAEEAAERLDAENIDAVYASDLQRASETGKAIARRHGLEVQLDERLREIDQGEWTGLTPAQIVERWPDQWGMARHYTPRPGGETPHQVRERALAALADFVRGRADGEVVVCSHGGTIRWIAAETMGYDDKLSAGVRGLGNGGIVSVEGRIQKGTLVLSTLVRLDGKTNELDDPNV